MSLENDDTRKGLLDAIQERQGIMQDDDDDDDNDMAMVQFSLASTLEN